MELFGHSGRCAHVNARLNRQHHARAQHPRRAVDDGLARERIAPGGGLADFAGLGVGAAVVHVHAQPVAGAVHVKRKIGALFNHVLQAADLVGVQQPQVQHALGQHFDGGLVRVGKARASAGGVHRRLLGCQHQLVERALRPGEFAVGRKSAGDVRGVAVELATGVNQHQLAVAHQPRVGAVVQHAGVFAGRDDGAVGRALRAVAAKLVQQLGVQVVFAHLLARAQHARAELHGADVAPGADLRGAAHGGLLKRVFDQAHLVERLAQIALRGRAKRAIAHPVAQRLQPAVDARLQPLVGGKRIPDGVAAVHQERHAGVQLVNRIGLVHPQRGGRCLRPQANAVPGLALQVLGQAKQHRLAAAGNHHPGTGLGKAAEVMKIAVKAVQKVRVPVALLFRRGGNERDAMAADVGGQAGAAGGIRGGLERHGCILGTAGLWARCVRAVYC